MDFSILQKIASKTIGYDITPIKPMSKEETEKWIEDNERAILERNKAPEMQAYLKKYGHQKPYVLTPEEREIIKEVLNMSDERLDQMEIGIHEDGDINVRTPELSWRTLCGREWWVNLKEKKSRCVALS